MARIKPWTVTLDHAWLRPGYLRWKVRRIIRRSGAIAVRNLSSAAGLCMRAGAFVPSDGIGGAVPLRDGRGRVVVVLALGAVGSCMAFSFRRWGQVPKSSSAPRGESPAGSADGGGLRALTDAHRSRRQLQTGVPWRFSDHPGAPPGTTGCRPTPPPAVCSPLPCLQLPGQEPGLAASTGHRESQPAARHCERHDYGDHNDQAVAHELLR
jgi:hypothetical protein